MKTCQTYELAYELNEMGYRYVYIFPASWVEQDKNASIHSGSGKVIGHYDPRKRLWNFHNDRPLPIDCRKNDDSLGTIVDTVYLNLFCLLNLGNKIAKEPVFERENE